MYLLPKIETQSHSLLSLKHQGPILHPKYVGGIVSCDLPSLVLLFIHSFIEGALYSSAVLRASDTQKS